MTMAVPLPELGAMKPTSARLQQLSQIVVLPTIPDQNNIGSSTSTIDFDSTGASHTVKPKQRNSAQRRASHNAIERQRRENLNARFLDLASLLPNLAHIRRPSKSSIINTSIAHVRASRRHRCLASQQLRVLSEECESLRRDVNDWRDRAGVAVILPQPHRGEVFSMILAGGELEFEEGDLLSGDGEEEDDGEDYGANGGQYTRDDITRLEAMQHHQQLMRAHEQTHAGNAFQSPLAHNIPPPPRSSHSSVSSSYSSVTPQPWHGGHPRSAPSSLHPYVSGSASASHHQSSPESYASSHAFPDGPYDLQGQHRQFQEVARPDDPEEWMFVNESHHHSADGQAHRQATW
ncbi:hypothetical protein B0H10DRAFT_1631 [Mycena sp. CBHHK59/15]|nr:hypothetical protein B0H10DRAFT_1631 [Mycena sp. CBHHK59/15]